MSGRSSLRRVATPGRGHTNPFGATSPASDPHHTATMADAVRRCRWITIDINASGFLLLFLGPPEEKRRLIHGFDADFPTQSAVSRLIATRMAEDIGRRISVSTVPQWWSSRPATGSYECFTALEWCEGPVAGLHEASGIVFPVHADRGQSGVVIFTGDDMTIDNGMLFETHARCFALFAAVTRLRPIDGGSPPAISKRELECLGLTANGLTSEEIASELGLSVHTANQYLTNTAQKLNAVNRMHAVAKALRLGLIE
jgi:DNA-binding CsgD family transcriptional regulator